MKFISFHITSLKSIVYIIYIGAQNAILYQKYMFPNRSLVGHQISWTIETYVCLLFGFILELFSRLISRNTSKRTKLSQSRELNRSNQTDKNKSNQLNDIVTEQLFLAFITLIYFLGQFWMWLLYYHFNYGQTTYFVKTLGFFICLIVAYFVFRIPLYRHQYVGLVFIIIGALLCSDKLSKEPYALAFVRRLIYAASLYTYCVFVKFLLNKSKRLTIYSIQGFTGLYGLIFTFILCFALSFVDVIKEEGTCLKITCLGKKKMFEIQFFSDYLKFWADIGNYGACLFNIIANISTMYIIQFFGPVQVAIADFLYSLTNTIYELINGDTSGWNLYVSCIIVLIGFLIFNENIILRFCRLDQNTKKEIEKRVYDNNLDQNIQTMELENYNENNSISNF